MDRIEISSFPHVAACPGDFGGPILQDRPLEPYAEADRGCSETRCKFTVEDRGDFGTLRCGIRLLSQQRGMQTGGSQQIRGNANLGDPKSRAEASVGLDTDANKNGICPVTYVFEQRSPMQGSQHLFGRNQHASTAVDFPPLMPGKGASGANGNEGA